MDPTIETKEAPKANLDETLVKIGDVINIEDAEERGKATDEFISERLKSLTGSAVKRGISILSGRHEGFIHPDSKVVRNFIVDPIKIDDDEIYKVLLNTFLEFNNIPGWKEAGLRRMAPAVLITTLGKYFGNYLGAEGTEGANREFYTNHTTAHSSEISIKDFKGKGFAVCTEKAAVAQNLLAFMGFNTELIISSTCRLESPDEDDPTGHVYNLISTENGHSIFDPTNPGVVKNPEGKYITFTNPTYRITDEDYDRLMKGGQTQVIQNDEVRNGTETTKGPDKKIIYGGPTPR